MKRIEKRILGSIFSFAMIVSLLCTSASALVRSSAYLDSYGVVMTPVSNGVMIVTVDVEGVGRMTKIGASTIYIYESSDGVLFSRVKTYESSEYPELLGSGSVYYKDAVSYQGKVGYYYYAAVYVYAENANGSDEKRCTSVIKQAVA